MKAIYGVVGHFFSLLVGVFLFQIWYPELIFLTPPDATQEIFIRSLASFSFYGEPSPFFSLFALSLGIGAAFTFFILSTHPQEYKSYVSKILTGNFLIFFLFYVFCTNPASRPPSPRVDLGDWFLLACVLLMGSLSLIFGILWVIYLKRAKMLQSKQVDRPTPRIHYACPYCQRIFHANITYCPSCKKNLP